MSASSWLFGVLRPVMPRDSRAVELASAFALLFTGVEGLLTGRVFPTLAMYHPAEAWGVMALMLGLLQLISIIKHESIGVLQAILAWVSGLVWVYIGIADEFPNVHSWPAVTVGIGNLYAFVVTINLYLEARQAARKALV